MSVESSNEVTLKLGECLFEFTSFDNWCDTAKSKFKRHGVSGSTVGHMFAICVDAKQRVCVSGKEFMRARDEGAFPVRAYRLVL